MKAKIVLDGVGPMFHIHGIQLNNMEGMIISVENAQEIDDQIEQRAKLYGKHLAEEELIKLRALEVSAIQEILNVLKNRNLLPEPPTA
jgi:hypothetical protein